MTGGDGPLPPHGELVSELRTLREKGLIKLRRLDLPALSRAARASGFSPAAGTGAAGASDPPGVEAMLRAAVGRLGTGHDEAGRAAQYLFGLVQGTVGRRPTDLREAAAAVYHLSPETFRKEPERLLVDRVAEEILLLCRSPAAAPADAAGDAPDEPAQPAASGEDPDAHPHDELWRAWRHALARAGDPSYVEGRYGPFPVPHGGPAARGGRVLVRLGPIAQLRDIDVVVSSENVFLQPSRMFSPTLSGALRQAAAVRDGAGRVVTDVVADELSRWLAANHASGGPVPPGVVVPTSPGRLAERGVRRIYHAAVAMPRAGTHGYDVSAEVVLDAVHGCFALARAELGPPGEARRAMSLPLFGAGRGGLTPAEGFGFLWPALRDELAADPSWDVHLTVRTAAEAAAVLHGLHESRTAGF